MSTRIIPTNYHISLSDLEYGGSWRYHGSVRISGNVLESTDEIVLNAQDLGIESVVVNPVDNHEGSSLVVFVRLKTFLFCNRGNNLVPFSRSTRAESDPDSD